MVLQRSGAGPSGLSGRDRFERLGVSCMLGNDLARAESQGVDQQAAHDGDTHMACCYPWTKGCWAA